jgi:transposase
LTGLSPDDRGRIDSKHHLILDANGIPLAVSLTGGNRNDVTQLVPLAMASARYAASPVAPASGPGRVVADRGYDHDKHRRQLWRRGPKPVTARRATGTAPASAKAPPGMKTPVAALVAGGSPTERPPAATLMVSTPVGVSGSVA